MKTGTFFAFFSVFAILLSLYSFAYETIPGLDANSEEYQLYTSCFDSCSQCETQCKNAVLRNLAETKSDEIFCTQLPSEQQPNCLDNIYSRKALEQKDISFCGKISMEEEKQMCAFSVALSKAAASESEAECDALGEQASACKSAFYFSMAMNKLDTSYCGKLDENSRGLCMGRVEEEKRMQAPPPETPAEAEISQTPERGAQGEAGKGKIATYGAAGIATIALLIIAIIFIKKRGGKKHEDAPLVFQKQAEAVQPQSQQAQPESAQRGTK